MRSFSAYILLKILYVRMKMSCAQEVECWGENYILKDENQFSTTEQFWDCECEVNYIHPKSLLVCPRCGAHQDDRPDSRTNEVFAALMVWPEVSCW